MRRLEVTQYQYYCLVFIYYGFAGLISDYIWQDRSPIYLSSLQFNSSISSIFYTYRLYSSMKVILSEAKGSLLYLIWTSPIQVGTLSPFSCNSSSISYWIDLKCFSRQYNITGFVNTRFNLAKLRYMPQLLPSYSQAPSSMPFFGLFYY